MLDETARRREDRIAERFPDSGLWDRAEDLFELIDRLCRRSEEITEPIRWIRILYVVLGAAPVFLSTLETRIKRRRAPKRTPRDPLLRAEADDPHDHRPRGRPDSGR
ncbi:MAG: hypothetical protein AAF467_19995 [Actinomycetota bacterium]